MAVSDNLSAAKRQEVKTEDATSSNGPTDRNNNPLSEREMDVARVLATGASNAEIARNLTISPHTVKVHVRNIYEKLQVNSRTEASMVLVQRGWLTVSSIDAEDGEPPSISVELQQEAKPASALQLSPSIEVETQAALSPATLPEPLPLYHQESKPSTWQRIYLMAGMAIAVLSFFTPNLFSNSSPALDLLTDRGKPSLGKPTLQDEPRWMSRTPLREPRSRMAVAQADNKVYIIGGEIPGGEIIDRVDVYDLAINEWGGGASLPEKRSNAAAAVVNNSIYVSGGNFQPNPEYDESEISDTLWRFALSEDTNELMGWHRAGQLPATLTGAGFLAVGEALYLIGGWDGSEMRSEIWRLVPPEENEVVSTQSWALVNRMNVARAFFGTVYYNEKIYIVGGHDGQRELDLADTFDPISGIWAPLPPLRTPRGGLSLATNNNSIFALGGGWDGPINNHERFDHNTKIWSTFESPIPNEWRHMASFSHNNNLYLIGGWSGDYLENHFQYENLFQSIHLPIIQSN